MKQVSSNKNEISEST